MLLENPPISIHSDHIYIYNAYTEAYINMQ